MGKKHDKKKHGKKAKAAETERPKVQLFAAADFVEEEAPKTKTREEYEAIGRAAREAAERDTKAKAKATRKAEKKAARFLDESADASAEVADAPRDPATIDRSDIEAVRDYNAKEGKASGHLITADAEVERELARLRGDESDEELKARLEAKRAARAAAQEVTTAETMEAVDAAVAKAKKSKKAPEHVAEEVETEHGREFEVGPASEREEPTASVKGDVMMPAEDTNPDFEVNGNGQYKVLNPATGKERGYTRVTTYIDCLDDRSRLEQWKMREVLIGAGLDIEQTPDGQGGTIAHLATDAFHEWEKAYRKADKREAKGELDLGQFGLLKAEADKKLRDACAILAERALEFAGANEKRQHGTDLHKLTEQLDRGEISLTDEEKLVAAGLATHADFADLRAYRAEMDRLGIEHFAIEKRVVLDDIHVAGTLDRASYYKPADAARRIRVVGDIKTGRVDYSAGKIGMQLSLYSRGQGYDRKAPAERENLRLSKAVALLIHLPAGEAKCTVYEVDLGLAAKGVKLAADVRAWRNEGKKTYDLKSPLGSAS